MTSLGFVCFFLLDLLTVQPKKPPEKATLLVGVWEVSKSKTAPNGALLELTADGKAIVSVTVADKKRMREGTYQLTGNKLTITMMVDIDTLTETYEVTKITENMLTLRDSTGSYDDYIRQAVLKK